MIILGNTSPALASIFRSTMLSARVGPMLRIAMGSPSSLAWITNLYPEKTNRLLPTTSIPSDFSTSRLTLSTRLRGTLSPKNTTDGFMIPESHFGQFGTEKPATSSSDISTSPSGRISVLQATVLGFSSSNRLLSVIRRK